MAPKDLDKLIEKYLQGKCSKAECDLIDSLYAGLGKNQDHPVTDVFEKRISSAETKILNNLEAHTHSAEDEPSAGRQRPFLWQYTGIAASLILCLAGVYYFFPRDPSNRTAVEENSTAEFTTIENSADARKRVILPDGSIVEMSPASSIRFSTTAQALSRELFLEGEAYFDVAHDLERPFFVYAGDVVTRVLGTSFVVRAMGTDEKVTVSVKTGKVTVYSRNAMHKKTVLVPNQEAIYDRTTDIVATQPIPVAELDDYRQEFAEMHFEETPVPDVLATLTETYDIDIIFPAEILSGCVLTSSFYEEGLYDRIDVICTAIGATYKIVDAQIVIESQGCNLKPE